MLGLQDILRAAISGDAEGAFVDPMLTQEPAQTQKAAQRSSTTSSAVDALGLADLAEKLGTYGVEKLAGVDIKHTAENRSSHPALASNAQAINFTKKVKSQITQGNLKKELHATPYADPIPAKVLSRGQSTDPNINAGKGKRPQDPEALKAEIQRRLQQGGSRNV